MQEDINILELKWIERFYTIDLNYKQEFVESINITDTNVLKNISNSNKPVELNKSNFPHKTYAIVRNNEETDINQIYTNILKIFFKLKPFFQLVITEDPSFVEVSDKSNYTIESNDGGTFYFENELSTPPDLKLITIDEHDKIENRLYKPSFEIKVPKNDLSIDLIIQMKKGLEMAS
jgi:hypothetical protein